MEQALKVGMMMKFPNMHDELCYYLRFLSDEDYQRREWLPNKRSVNFDYIVHFLFDDTKLSRDADDCIGMFLRDANEASHIREVVQAIDILLDTYGSGLTDAEYIAKPEWRLVLNTAQAALGVVSAGWVENGNCDDKQP